MIVKGWEIDEFNGLYSPKALNLSDENQCLSEALEGEIEIERLVRGYGYTAIYVPVEVLRAYLTAYDNWKASK